MGDLLAFDATRDTLATHASAGAPPRPAARPVEPEPLWRELVGLQLRQARRDQQRTLADVGARAGISVQYLSEVERGLKEPSSEVLAAVAGALGLGLLDLTVGVARSLRPLRAPERRPAAPVAPAGAAAPAGPVCLAV
ncbi:MAG: transcriptional regulator [Nocardioides sp.]|nr:transcriptional regulator [Nocardioides sp.]